MEVATSVPRHAFTPGTEYRLDSKGRRIRLCAVCGFIGRGGGHNRGDYLPQGADVNITWTLRTGSIREDAVEADQWAAWNTLRNRAAEDFGLIAVAIPNGDEERMIPVQTAALMRTWGRTEDAARFDDLARSKGLIR